MSKAIDSALEQLNQKPIRQRKPPSGRLPETGFVRLHEVLFVYPVSRATWYAGVKSGRYPKPVKLGPQMYAWKVEDIRALIEGAA